MPIVSSGSMCRSNGPLIEILPVAPRLAFLTSSEIPDSTAFLGSSVTNDEKNSIFFEALGNSSRRMPSELVFP